LLKLPSGLQSAPSEPSLTHRSWVFWLSGVAALTAALGGGQRCSHSSLTYCSQLVAAEAFGWIEVILISVVFVFVLVIGSAALRRGDRLSAGLV
jgi:hypothetical protein